MYSPGKSHINPVVQTRCTNSAQVLRPNDCKHSTIETGARSSYTEKDQGTSTYDILPSLHPYRYMGAPPLGVSFSRKVDMYKLHRGINEILDFPCLGFSTYFLTVSKIT